MQDLALRQYFLQQMLIPVCSISLWLCVPNWQFVALVLRVLKLLCWLWLMWRGTGLERWCWKEINGNTWWKEGGEMDRVAGMLAGYSRVVGLSIKTIQSEATAPNIALFLLFLSYLSLFPIRHVCGGSPRGEKNCVCVCGRWLHLNNICHRNWSLS